MVTKKEFIQSYAAAIRKGKAGVFVGAGNSIASGFVDWESLLRPLAEEMGLDIESEHDYLSVAQYYVNFRGNKTKLSNHIVECFSKEKTFNKNADILTRLPIKTYWTTNYDHVIENYITKNKKQYNVYKRIDNIAVRNDDSIISVYKMHGDIDDIDTIVLTKSDYLNYEYTHPYFLDLLQNSLMTKTFMFIGYSLSDPDIDLILGYIKLILRSNVKEHYIIFKKEDDGYKYKKQKLFIENLKKFGLQSVLVDDYKDIPSLLQNIEKELNMNNVFISGSYCDNYSEWNKDKIEELASLLSYILSAKGYKIISGFGLGIGSAVVNGALNYVYEEQNRKIDDSLAVHPFPQNIIDSNDRMKRYTEYRKSMIKNTGVAIFMFGYKYDENRQIIAANGCMEEYEIAKENKNIIIPLASTGFAAKKIYEEMFLEKEKYSYLDGYWDLLKNNQSVNDIINTVMDILEETKYKLYE